MRILITGYTTRMWGSKRTHGDYVTFSFLLEDILKELGHQVERRSIVIGEDITYVYDYAFCGVAPLSSMTSAKVPETHYIMDCLPGRHAVYADDWSFCDFGKSVKYALDRWDKYVDYKNFSYDSSILEKTYDSLNRMMMMQTAGNNAPVLAPMFPWGDHDFLMRDNYKANLITIDPSSWVRFPTMNMTSFSNKKKQWVMAALSNHTRWVEKQKFTLPVVYVGNKRMGDGLVLSETNTVKLFGESYGVLATGYPSAGSGWWRTRFLNAAWAESLVYADVKDQAIMGEPFKGSVFTFESLNSLTYARKVVEQGIWLSQNLSPRDEAISVIERLIAK